MPVTVRRRAKTHPVRTVSRLSNVGQVIAQESGCSRSTNDGTRDTGASLLNAFGVATTHCQRGFLHWGTRVLVVRKVRKSNSVALRDSTSLIESKPGGRASEKRLAPRRAPRGRLSLNIDSKP